MEGDGRSDIRWRDWGKTQRTSVKISGPGAKFEPGTSEIRSRSTNHRNATLGDGYINSNTSNSSARLTELYHMNSIFNMQLCWDRSTSAVPEFWSATGTSKYSGNKINQNTLTSRTEMSRYFWNRQYNAHFFILIFSAQSLAQCNCYTTGKSNQSVVRKGPQKFPSRPGKELWKSVVWVTCY
jgi:hypothetical protein